MTLEEAQEQLKELEWKEFELKDRKRELEKLIEDLTKEYRVVQVVFENTKKVEHHLLGKISHDAAREWMDRFMSACKCDCRVHLIGMDCEEYAVYRIARDFKEFKLRVISYITDSCKRTIPKDASVDYLIENFVIPFSFNDDFIDEEDK